MSKANTANSASAADVGAAARRLDALAIVTLAIVAAIAAFTFRDYGLAWDDYTHAQYGDLLVSLYRSGFSDQRALSFVNLYRYGGGFDLLATLTAKVSPFGLFETRRLVGAAVGIAGLLVTWRLGRRLGGPLAGLITLLLLATCPLYYGNMFMNAKDAPFAVAMAIALLGTVRAFDEYPHALPATIALCGIGIGLAIGSRVIVSRPAEVIQPSVTSADPASLRWLPMTKGCAGVALAGVDEVLTLVRSSERTAPPRESPAVARPPAAAILIVGVPGEARGMRPTSCRRSGFTCSGKLKDRRPM